MSQEQTKLGWLQAELNAVILKQAEVETAKAAYMASYEIAKERLEDARDKLEQLVEDNTD